MARFTTRVELHNSATWGDYEQLHSGMESHGYKRTITEDDTGESYHLPWAEYNLIADVNKDGALARAHAAAATVGKPFSLLVTESKGRTWENLKRA